MVVGAGVSGIGAAWHLHHDLPDVSFVVLEGRDAIGGTWDLFRYPGVRSDSDPHTYAYAFKPWSEPGPLASGDSILRYLDETLDEYGLREHVRLGHRVHAARVVVRRVVLDGRRGARRRRGRPAAVFVGDRHHRLLPLRPRSPPGLRRCRAVSRSVRARAGLASRARRGRAARRGHRQRSDRGDARARARRARCARHDAAAVPELLPLVARARSRRGSAPAPPPATTGVRVDAQAEPGDPGALLPPLPLVPAGHAQGPRARRRAPVATRLRRRAPLHPPVRPVGPAGVRDPRRRSLRVHLGRRRRRRHRHDRRVHRDGCPVGVGRRARRRRGGRGDRARGRSRSATSRWRSTARRCSPATASSTRA